MPIEDRKSRRLKVESYLKVSYGDTGIELGKAADLSADGMRLCGRIPLQTDRTLVLRLASPANGEREQGIIFFARVIWCARAGNTNLYDTGVRFIDQTQKQADYLANLIRLSTYDDRWAPIVKELKG